MVENDATLELSSDRTGIHDDTSGIRPRPDNNPLWRRMPVLRSTAVVDMGEMDCSLWPSTDQYLRWRTRKSTLRKGVLFARWGGGAVGVVSCEEWSIDQLHDIPRIGVPGLVDSFIGSKMFDFSSSAEHAYTLMTVWQYSSVQYLVVRLAHFFSTSTCSTLVRSTIRSEATYGALRAMIVPVSYYHTNI